MINVTKAEDCTSLQLTEFILDVLHRISVHQIFWFREVEKQLGSAKALQASDYVWQKLHNNVSDRINDFINAAGGTTKTLTDLPCEKQLQLLDNLAKYWLAQDGVWFQAVEFSEGMAQAKLCNDATWKYFSPFEAQSVKKLLGLGEHPGLKGLELALNFRIYGRINVQSTHWDKDTLIFEMNDCRVQSARKRKGLADYPCKSAGIAEYSCFAKGIDEKIQTACLGCPPDNHPEQWFCSWKFKI